MTTGRLHRPFTTGLHVPFRLSSCQTKRDIPRTKGLTRSSGSCRFRNETPWPNLSPQFETPRSIGGRRGSALYVRRDLHRHFDSRARVGRCVDVGSRSALLRSVQTSFLYFLVEPASRPSERCPPQAETGPKRRHISGLRFSTPYSFVFLTSVMTPGYKFRTKVVNPK